MIKATLVLALLISSTSAVSKITDVYKTSSAEYITFDKFISIIPATGHIVMGEFHNDPLIQNAQSEIIEKKVLFEKLPGDFSVMWEFLNYTEQEKIQTEFRNLETNLISAKEFIIATAGKQNLTYAPIFSATANLGGKIAGINLPRSLKQAVVKGGIEAISPEYVPTNHYAGGEAYLSRFVAAMGGHVPEEKIQRYFLAQCLTDSVMAHQINLNHTSPLNFVIAGSFHTDFYDGTVVRLKNIYNNVVTLKIINKNNLSQEGLNEIISGDPTYGVFADYIIVTDD